MPAAGQVTRWEADRSTPSWWQYSSATREPRSSPSRVDRPALTPIRLAALAAVTAPPQEIANSSAKISSPGAGRDGTSPKTISRYIVPNAIRSMALALMARRPGWRPVPCGRSPSPEGHRRGVGPGHMAGGTVPRDQLPQGRGDLVALIDGERAPPPEPAAGCGVDHPWWLTLVGLLRDVEFRAGVGDGREQQLRVGMPGTGQHFLDGARFRDVARVHHDQPVGHVPGTGDVVGDVEDRHALLAAQVSHHVEQADPDGHVQHGDRLVGQDQLGPHGQGLGETDPLPLAAAELVRVALHDLGS